ncbi:hypothetical protein [Helicobacter jaachi]|nr:hypothetical protein [Helicobacter jaachi]
MNLKSLLKITMSKPNLPLSTISTLPTARTAPAFMLIDAAMGICICASAFALGFSFLYALTPTPKPSTYRIYKQLLLSPNTLTTSISTQSQPSLTYDVIEQSFQGSNGEFLRFYSPTQIR